MDYFFRSLNHGGRIVGGEEATPNEYPSQVGTEICENKKNSRC